MRRKTTVMARKRKKKRRRRRTWRLIRRRRKRLGLTALEGRRLEEKTEACAPPLPEERRLEGKVPGRGPGSQP